MAMLGTRESELSSPGIPYDRINLNTVIPADIEKAFSNGGLMDQTDQTQTPTLAGLVKSALARHKHPDRPDFESLSASEQSATVDQPGVGADTHLDDYPSISCDRLSAAAAELIDATLTQGSVSQQLYRLRRHSNDALRAADYNTAAKTAGLQLNISL